jgi:hypothetical protein
MSCASSWRLLPGSDLPGVRRLQGGDDGLQRETNARGDSRRDGLVWRCASCGTTCLAMDPVLRARYARTGRTRIDIPRPAIRPGRVARSHPAQGA